MLAVDRNVQVQIPLRKIFFHLGLELDRLFRWPIVPIVRTADVEADVECYRLSTE